MRSSNKNGGLGLTLQDKICVTHLRCIVACCSDEGSGGPVQHPGQPEEQQVVHQLPRHDRCLFKRRGSVK